MAWCPQAVRQCILVRASYLQKIIFIRQKVRKIFQTQVGGATKEPLVPPPTWFWNIFLNFCRMMKIFCRWLALTRIHFLTAWGHHAITGNRWSRARIYINIGNYRQKWRFLVPLNAVIFLSSSTFDPKHLGGRRCFSKPKERSEECQLDLLQASETILERPVHAEKHFEVSEYFDILTGTPPYQH